MPQEVQLSKDDRVESVIVKKAVLTDDHVRLEGFDPSFCPPGMECGIQFFSKDLTAIIDPNGPVTVCEVKPTDEPVPDPDVTF